MNSVFDANCWAKYVEEWLSDGCGLAMSAYDVAMKNGSIIFDENNVIRQQYIDMKKPLSEELFDMWFSDHEVLGKVRKYSASMSNGVFIKELRSLGIPDGEYIYFKVAKNSGAKYIISEDIDFFDPSQKNCGADKRLEITSNSSAPVCKHMKRRHDILIRNLEGFLDCVDSEATIGGEAA